jgi:EAL domain-containing protein (putative c-di-GMP-specific phosphodiesterase class I)
VLKRACHDAMQWPDVDGEAPFVSVKPVAAAAPTERPRRARGQVLRDSRLASARLHLELTESVLMDDAPGSMATLMELHDSARASGWTISAPASRACRTSSACPSTG